MIKVRKKSVPKKKIRPILKVTVRLRKNRKYFIFVDSIFEAKKIPIAPIIGVKNMNIGGSLGL
ncbi:hypothetical protein CBF28_09405 [Vagococcus carniphilus]|uniref:Uncharacterized protein n=1 Tax=Vagococcus carniphilus TaxID=218144 RepID=A0A430B023_9ENTE|nr:hypothetical protein CBF28_09405 [Vagococcus carniphilus]